MVRILYDIILDLIYLFVTVEQSREYLSWVGHLS